MLPDKITIFQGSIEAVCSTDAEVVNEVRDTVVHEVAHHFGIDDASLGRDGGVARTIPVRARPTSRLLDSGTSPTVPGNAECPSPSRSS